jgi:S-adenosylmethionine decarboxylase
MEHAIGLRAVYRSDALDALARDDSSIREDYKKQEAWGLLASIDLHKCDPALIRDKEAVTRHVHELCDRIGMKRFGETVVVNFGEDPRVSGFSMTQLIETSLISGHYANQSNAVYLDVFSCKYYNPFEVAEFSKEFFGAKNYNLTYTLRK